MSRPTHQRRRFKAILLALLVMLLGIGWRMLPLGLPRFAWKYGGSALWAIMVYWLLAALLPRTRPRNLLLLAAAIALAVELSRLIDLPWLNDFRETLAGRLILGKYFSLKNVVVYWAAIALTAAADAIVLWPECFQGHPPHKRPRPPAV